MKKLDCTGKLIAVDMYSCGEKIISDAAAAREALRQACAENQMGLRDIVCSNNESQSEYALIAVCERGHVALHIYPELGFVAADIFTCLPEADSAGTARRLRSLFESDKSKITLLDRGDFGTESDMKPHRRSNTRLMRRTANFGGKLKKMMLKPRSI